MGEPDMWTTEGRKGGRKRKEIIKFVLYTFLPVPYIFSRKLEVSDSLRGSYSNISAAQTLALAIHIMDQTLATTMLLSQS
jgi:hypothetical protein